MARSFSFTDCSMQLQLFFTEKAMTVLPIHGGIGKHAVEGGGLIVSLFDVIIKDAHGTLQRDI